MDRFQHIADRLRVARRWARRWSGVAARLSLASSLAAALAATVVPVTAQERSLGAYYFDSQERILLVYAWSNCPWECAVVVFDCSNTGSIDVSVGELSGPAVVRWLELDNADPPLPTAELRLGSDTIELVFRSLGYADINSTWTAHLFPRSYGWLLDFADADSTAIVASAFSIELPDEEADREARAAFAEACLAL